MRSIWRLRSQTWPKKKDYLSVIAPRARSWLAQCVSVSGLESWQRLQNISRKERGPKRETSHFLCHPLALLIVFTAHIGRYFVPMSILDIVGDDSRFFELALQDYRDTTGDFSKFVDLHRTAQHIILQRAQRLKDSNRQGVFTAGAPARL